MIIMLVAMMGLMYFMMIRPQKKKQKEEQNMRDNIQIGDEITTIGGIMGRVVTVKEDSLIIETGADRNKMKITKWAVSANNTANEKAEAERQAAREAAEAEKKAKMEEAADKSKARRKKTKKKDDTFDF
ncbi:MAG: preprotein translocase subunit YajC [Clostridia bacterium]|nr:preprotein translocase subunit YajC [Clostridia bacterium]